MGLRVTAAKKKKPNPDRKKTATVRKPITTKSFDKGEVTKGGKFKSMSNADVKRRTAGVKARISEAFPGDAKRYANNSHANVNRASGEAARRARKRTKKQR